ncbi:MOSC domain-containing protein [Paracoccus aestuariivivens]|uniref:MOSC domain-containing protein n=1 Tax=Paracoccus aestuariivivens TaxID=1820333 RepID=A0A6L6J6A1_9RHOB|nr:MOSC domain-containing protein [Paracoccus aestuariivivens]MTH76127.1 MOSC domain-containing protein [Paracoccus aestuariivivens]
MPQITLLTGRIAPLPDTDQVSGIDKSVVDRPLQLGTTGLEGDEQADLRVHGGPEKAVHHYPFDHYAAWRTDLGDLPILSTAGGFGENISTLGMTEDTVSVGDIFRLGGALVQVSQGRQPCWKLTRRIGVEDMARRVQKTGRTGWYYRVLQAGQVAPDDMIELVDRVAPDWTLHRLWHALYIDRMNLRELHGIASLDVLADGWRRYAIRRLESGQVEDWSRRLEGGA